MRIAPALITIPESYYVGADVFYEVHELNNFYRFMNQKYRSRAEIVADFPMIFDNYTRAKLPEYVISQLRDLLKQVGKTPLIFRSSSLLEDSFDTSFAGKYDSFFLPNQARWRRISRPPSRPSCASTPACSARTP
jgi:phosphoenolpyruvate synthase/pyruvate phosphate dikinase